MTTLGRAIGTQDNLIQLSAPLDVGSFGAPYTLDSENILVTGGDGSAIVSVSRGQNGSAPAAHTLGTTLTAGWGGGGGGGLPAGGATGAAAVKLSATDGDAGWSDATGTQLQTGGPRPSVPDGYILGGVIVTGPDINGGYGEVLLWGPSAGAPGVQMQRTQGTLAAPAATNSTDVLGFLEFLGTGTDTIDVGDLGADIRGVQEGAADVGLVRARIEFRTTDNAFNGITERMRINAAGDVISSAVAAPADAALAAGQFALWLDDTDGAAKLMIKAKSANGTVVTGSVNLT